MATTQKTTSPNDRVVVRFKRAVNCPRHLTRLGRKPSKAEREKLAAGSIPQRRFHGGRQYTMTRAELSRYCLKENLDYRVERVIRAVPDTQPPPPNPETPDGPQPPGEAATDTDTGTPAATGEPAADQGAQPPAEPEPAGDGPGHQAGAAEQPAAVDADTASASGA